MISSNYGLLAVVFVVAAPPHTVLVAAEWRAVEPWVHAPDGVHSALVGRVGVVDDAVLERESAHAGPFASVGLPVRAKGRLAPGVPGAFLASRRAEVHGTEVVVDGSGLPFLLGV